LPVDGFEAYPPWLRAARTAWRGKKERGIDETILAYKDDHNTHQAHALECGSSSYEFVRELGLVVAIVDFLVRIAREETHVEKVELIGSCGREGELGPR
jgi:hypothetical protein